MSETMEPIEAPSYTRMTADVYDAIYAKKNYEAEATALKGIIFGASTRRQVLKNPANGVPPSTARFARRRAHRKTRGRIMRRAKTALLSPLLGNDGEGKNP